MKLLVFMFFLLYSSFCMADVCRPEGMYQKSGQAKDTLTIRTVQNELELQLSVAGKLLQDGNRTSGAAKGPFFMSSDGCVGVYVSPENECTLVVVFEAASAKVHQFGSFLFGAGVWGGGEYRRLKHFSGKGLNRRANQTGSKGITLRSTCRALLSSAWADSA